MDRIANAGEFSTDDLVVFVVARNEREYLLERTFLWDFFIKKIFAVSVERIVLDTGQSSF